MLQNLSLNFLQQNKSFFFFNTDSFFRRRYILYTNTLLNLLIGNFGVLSAVVRTAAYNICIVGKHIWNI